MFSSLRCSPSWRCGVSQKELLEQNAAQQQKLLSEFQAALGKNQTDLVRAGESARTAKLNAGLTGSSKSTALLLEEAARMTAAAVRRGSKISFKDVGVTALS